MRRRKLEDSPNEVSRLESTSAVGQMQKSIKNMAGSSRSDPYLIVDDDIFPISDEKYAEQLQLQEALIYSALSPIQNTSIASSSSSPWSSLLTKQPMVSKSRKSLERRFCGICMDTKTLSEMFQNNDECGHLYCSECIREHVAAKISENQIMVTCPDPNCKVAIGSDVCKSIVPKEVLERWENLLCESVINEAAKFYCPFKDCSALLVDDGGVAVTSSECPNCNRLFCAQCKVAWHCGKNCNEFQSLKKGEPSPDDILLNKIAKTKNWMMCPKCKLYVEKVYGCHHISCRCGQHFCYGCGKAKENGSNHMCSCGKLY